MANTPPVPPITNQFPIVDGGGRPTDYFIRWLQERGFQIDEMLTPEQVAQLIEEWSATRSVIAGTGLGGGGTLNNDVTLTLDAALGDLNDVDLSTPPTDGQVIVYDQASNTWKPADQSGGGGGGGGAYTLIQDIQVAVATGAITFAAISQTFDHLKIVWEALGGSAGSDAQVYMRFNNDNASNYSGFLQNGFGSGSNSTELAAGVGPKPGGSGLGEDDIFDYSSTSPHKNYLFRSTVQQSPQFNEWGGGYWNSAAAITEIDLFRSDGGTFGVGSRFRLYGWKASSGGGGGSSTEAPWVKPAVASFTTRTGTSASIADFPLGVVLSALITSSNTNDLTYCVQNIIAPGAAGWKATGRFRRTTPLGAWMGTGMILRDSVGGRSRLYWLGQDVATGFNRNQYSSDTAWNSVTAIANFWYDMDFWMQIEDNLTDHIIRISKSGYNWQEIYRETRTNWMTPNQIGFFLNPNGGGGAGDVNMQNHPMPFECLSWEQQALP